ncbi:MAG: uracil-DNA glycosylase family protein [Cyanophyceae cyanobacterium]
MSDIETLIAQTQQEAQREDFPVDQPVYRAAKKDPTYPVLYAGNLKSKCCFFGRDLGRDEVFAGQPLIGAAGSLVREGLYRAIHHQEANGKEDLATVCDRVLLSNTVPYKPPGNKAYSAAVKKRFRPFVERLLVMHWQGHQIITLGTEAFKWFIPYGRKGEVTQFWEQGDDRYTAKLEVTLTASDEQGMTHQRQVTLLPLPHPSPLNQTYYDKFPEMLQERLNEFAF